MSEKIKAAVLKTRTDNNRIAKTIVSMPFGEIVVINRRILAHKNDLDEGWFRSLSPIYYYRDFVLMESQMAFWVSSFKAIVDAFEMLNKELQK
jgi:hypothetical protein